MECQLSDRSDSLNLGSVVGLTIPTEDNQILRLSCQYLQGCRLPRYRLPHLRFPHRRLLHRMAATLQISLLLALLFAAFDLAAATRGIALELTTLDQAEPLKKNEGYLLVDLAVAGTSPSFEFSQVRIGSKQKYLVADQSLSLGSTRWQVSLKDKAAGFYQVKLPAGLYQITEVNAPLFNLPFRVDTDKRDQWRFSIAKARSNYIGRFRIDQERGTDYVNVKLINRLAADYDQLVEQGASIFSAAPLRSGAGVRDDFYDFISSINQAPSNE